MNIYYNETGIGDVLMIPFVKGERYEIRHEAFKDVTKITDTNGTLLGYNLFNASTYLELDANGKIELTENLAKEIESIFEKNGLTEKLPVDFSPKFVVGYVNSKDAHENADKLSVCEVNVGTEALQIVCGAKNVDAGQKVVVAKVGATMPGGLEIKPTELRGVPSNGMICSRKELGLPSVPEEEGIYVLEDSFKVGEPFKF